MFMCGKKVMEHFMSPIQAGGIINEDFIGGIGNPAYVDTITSCIKVKDNKK